MVFEANTRNKTKHTMWKGMENYCARNVVIFCVPFCLRSPRLFAKCNLRDWLTIVYWLFFFFSCAGSGQSTVTQFRDKVMQSAASRSKQAAWRHEKALVKNGFTGYGDWTRSQRSELKSRGQVGGYDALQLQPVGRFPQLVRDQSNFGFVSELQQQRRRKNRHERKSRKNSRE